MPSRRLFVSLATLALAAGLLLAEGHRWWCRCEQPFLGTASIHSLHTSQHLADPYTLTHVLHGILFFAMLRPLARRFGPGTRMNLALAIEAIWEVAENTSWTVERYRQNTIALGYSGDSVANSLGDIAACWLGYRIASRIPARWSVAIFAVVEVSLLVLYRDNFTLNVVMFFFPSEAIKSWQMGE